MEHFWESYRPWLKLAFFAFCVAVFLFFLQFIFGGQIGRYQMGNGVRNIPVILDTATGALYTADGKQVAPPIR